MSYLAALATGLAILLGLWSWHLHTQLGAANAAGAAALSDAATQRARAVAAEADFAATARAMESTSRRIDTLLEERKALEARALAAERQACTELQAIARAEGQLDVEDEADVDAVVAALRRRGRR